MITGKTYDTLKFLAQIVLPALGTLYFTLAGLWGLPAAEEVVGTIVAIDTFLGVVLQISSTAYEKSGDQYGGDLVVKEVGDKKVFSLELNDDPEILEKKDEVSFKVVRE